MASKKVSIPKDIPSGLRLLAGIVRQRDALSEQDAELAAQEKVLREMVDQMMQKQQLPHVKVPGVGQAHYKHRVVGEVDDWDEVQKYIKRYNAWELLPRRLSSTAYMERVKAGKAVPGITTKEFDVFTFTPDRKGTQ